jgi:hypothetical protein
MTLTTAPDLKIFNLYKIFKMLKSNLGFGSNQVDFGGYKKNIYKNDFFE